MARISDQSKIKDLNPSQFKDIRFKELKSNLRYHGSFNLRLRRPSKTPAYTRPYSHGDPLGLIDWKVFAKSDQLLVREEHDESSARVLILIDSGSTMSWPDEALRTRISNPTASKLELALRVGMNLSFIHFRMADFVKLLIWDGQGPDPKQMIPLRTASDVLTEFDRIKGAGFQLGELRLEEFRYNGGMFDLVYLISDGMEAKIQKWIYGKSHKLRLIHCLSKLEVSDDWLAGSHCYFDHSGKKIEYLGSALKDKLSFVQGVKRWCDSLQADVEKRGCAYQRVTDDTSILDYQDQLISYPFVKGT